MLSQKAMLSIIGLEEGVEATGATVNHSHFLIHASLPVAT